MTDVITDQVCSMQSCTQCEDRTSRLFIQVSDESKFIGWGLAQRISGVRIVALDVALSILYNTELPF